MLKCELSKEAECSQFSSLWSKKVICQGNINFDQRKVQSGTEGLVVINSEIKSKLSNNYCLFVHVQTFELLPHVHRLVVDFAFSKSTA